VKVVVDTNVLASGTLKTDTPPGMILQMILDGRLEAVISIQMAAEYMDVLIRPAFGFSPDSARKLVSSMAPSADWVDAPGLELDLPDPDDRIFIECALAGRAECIVTGNKRHFPAGACHGIPVLSPAEFLDAFKRGAER